FPDQYTAAALASEQGVLLADLDDALGSLGAVADQAGFLVAIDGGDDVGIAAALDDAVVNGQDLFIDLFAGCLGLGGFGGHLVFDPVELLGELVQFGPVGFHDLRIGRVHGL